MVCAQRVSTQGGDDHSGLSRTWINAPRVPPRPVDPHRPTEARSPVLREERCGTDARDGPVVVPRLAAFISPEMLNDTT
jgi:hypothetical protein